MTTSNLITRDSKGKIRVIILECEHKSDMSVIHRQSGLFGGKMTQQPDVVILQGKVKRSISAQAELQFMSLRKKAMDKGYKELKKSISEYSLADLNKLLPETKTDANGFSKHMLAKQADKVKPSSIDKVKYWYASKKIDGLRCSFYMKDGEVKSASRGGGNYDPATLNMRNKLKDFFTHHPDWILDGELYKLGKSLQNISSAVRKEDGTQVDWLQYYIYDVMIPDMAFKDRLIVLNKIKEELNLGFDPEREFSNNELPFQVVPHEKVSGYDNINKLHDQYVSEGWEGVVIRNPDKVYGFGKRTNDMLKVKKYLDSTVLIVNKEAGLRGSEDMVFICQMKDGRQFKAKPFGTRADKEDYWNNFDTLCKNKIGELKYFYLSDDGIPLQPSMKCIRYDITEPEL